MPTQALIVSGEDAVVRRLTAALSEIGVEVKSVAHTGAALPLLSKMKFEAVVVDCDLEGGMDLLELIRQEERNQRALVLACVSGNEGGRQASVLGANFIVPKPINWEIAKRTLRAAQSMILRERRESIREKVRTDAKVFYNNQVLDAHLVDLSETGLLLESDRLPMVGSQLKIEFRLPSGRSSVQCTSKVIWAKGNQFGTQFMYLSAANADTIISWLAQHSPRYKAASPGRSA